MPKKKRSSGNVSGERFTGFTSFAPDKMPWADLLHRSERIDFEALRRAINSGDVVQFDDITEGHVQNWLDLIFEKLGKLNVGFLYLSDDPGRLFLMSPAVADEWRVSDVQEAPTFATH